MIPLAVAHTEDGPLETDEEQKLRHESRKILHLSELRISGTCVSLSRKEQAADGAPLSINVGWLRQVATT